MKAVNVNMKDVKKASMQALRQDAPPSFVLVLAGEGPLESCLERTTEEPNMSVLVYILLTVAIFGLLGLVQKLVEGL